MELVSVVVPIYNVEKYLNKCIESIRNQTYTNLEIILVDDESPDGCGKMCDEYACKDRRIKVIHKKNGGLADARNAGVKETTGTYLLFVDSDDWINVRLIEKTVDAAEKNKAEMVLFNYVSVDEEGRLLDLYEANLTKNKVISIQAEPRLLNSAPSAVNKLFKTEFFKSSGLSFPTGRYYEDLGTIPKLILLAKRVFYIDSEPLYYYLMRSGSIMHVRNFEKNYRDRTSVLDDVLYYYRMKGKFQEYEKELEFLVLDNGYFLPCKEIVLVDEKNKILEKFQHYMNERFPEFDKNVYVATFTLKNKILFKLLIARKYKMMLLMSYARRALDFLLRKKS